VIKTSGSFSGLGDMLTNSLIPHDPVPWASQLLDLKRAVPFQGS
jgi:hypothetical protein